MPESNEIATIGDGLRNVDEISLPDVESATSFVKSLAHDQFLGCGQEMLCFKLPYQISSRPEAMESTAKIAVVQKGLTDLDSIPKNMALVPNSVLDKEPTPTSNVLLIPIINPIGASNIENIIKDMSKRTDDISPIMEHEAARLANETPQLYEKRLKSNAQRIPERVAAHNSVFKRGPIETSEYTVETMPINAILSVEGKPFGVIMKAVEGKLLFNSKVGKLHQNLGGDSVSGNYLLTDKISATGKPVVVLLDLYRFTPSL